MFKHFFYFDQSSGELKLPGGDDKLASYVVIIFRSQEIRIPKKPTRISMESLWPGFSTRGSGGGFDFCLLISRATWSRR